MISLLIISPKKQEREQYALAFCKEKLIDQFDITTFQPETSLGIEDVRELQKKIILMPRKSKEKALVIFDAHLATIESQNALLKLLEEPPANTYIILTAQTEKAFLPTILSRCKVILLENEQKLTDTKQEEEFIDNLFQASIAEKLFLAQEIAKDKETAKEKIERLLYTARLLMLKNPNELKYANITLSLQQTYQKATNTNINLRMLLENLFLHI